MWKNRNTRWLVPSHMPNFQPSPYVPTRGFPTTASDLFRVIGIHETGHEGWNSCYADVGTAVGLTRLVEGEVESYKDLEAAELALQVLMWHDRVDFVVPGFKVINDGGMVHYTHVDDKRSELTSELFAPVQPYDQIYAVEQVYVQEGVVRNSNLYGSQIVGKTLQESLTGYLDATPAQAEALSSVPLHMGVPAYFSESNLTPFLKRRGFFGEFYDITRKQWDEALSSVPDVDVNVALPPLLAIVLDRARGRDDIPRAILELRDELLAVRAEILSLNEFLVGANTQRQRESKAKSVKASFEAAFKVSRIRDASILLPILKTYRALRSPLDLVINALNPEYEVKDLRFLANRTVTGKVFSRLLDVDSIHTALDHFFTRSELNRIEESYGVSEESVS